MNGSFAPQAAARPGITAIMPASRDAIVHRLRGALSAYKIYTDKPKAMLAAFKSGKIAVPKNDADRPCPSRFAERLRNNQRGSTLDTRMPEAR
jgi:hypothetical protein